MITLHILNTRPRRHAPILTQALQQMGHTVTEFPLLRIDACSSITSCYQSLPTYQYDSIICTSAHAVAHSQPYLSTLTARHIIGIGPATCHALQEHGISHPLCPPTYSSDGILALPEMAAGFPQRILLLTGHDANPQLRQTLTQRGHDVTIFPTYKRVGITPNAPITKSIDLIIVTSKQSIEQLYRVTQHNWPILRQKPLIVITEAMRKLAISYHFSNNICVANKASNDALLLTVQYYVTQLKERT